jgi:DNA-binding NarL/FixJ family response regulator
LENAKNDPPIQILITAAFPAIRAGLRSLVASDPSIHVLAECASPSEWDLHIPQTDVILIAPIHSISAGWIENLSQKAPEIALLLLLSQPLTALPNLGKRGWGVLSFTASSIEIVLAIQALAHHLWISDPGLLPGAFTRSSEGQSDREHLPSEALTLREIDVLQCLAQGFTNKETARSLKISIETVKFHISSVYSKLGVNNRTEAVRMGVRQGWVNL